MIGRRLYLQKGLASMKWFGSRSIKYQFRIRGNSYHILGTARNSSRPAVVVNLIYYTPC